MVLHVISWFVIGVIMAPTFILMFLGMTCLAINIAAIWLKINQIEINYLEIFEMLLPKQYARLRS
jgi:hypothetical protein